MDWIPSCRAQGFDPIQLACHTCDVLSSLPIIALSTTTMCRSCCQPYKDIVLQRATQPYEAAVLVVPKQYRDHGGGEISFFLQEDWPLLVQSKKDGPNRMRRIERTAISNDSMINMNGETAMLLAMFQGNLMLSQGRVELLLMDRADALSSLRGSDDGDEEEEDDEDEYEHLLSQAKQVIPLDGLKRDDIKDMIQTLLR